MFYKSFLAQIVLNNNKKFNLVLNEEAFYTDSKREGKEMKSEFNFQKTHGAPDAEVRHLGDLGNVHADLTGLN